MRRSELFRALADLVFWGDLEELEWTALREAFGDESVKDWAANTPKDIEGEVFKQLHVVEALLRLAKGAGLPKEVGMDVERRKVNEWAEPLKEGVWEIRNPFASFDHFERVFRGDLASALAACEGWFPGRGEEALRLLGTWREREEGSGD